MILMTFFLAIIVGLRNKLRKIKTMRTGRCGCNPWCFENHLECPLNSEVWNSFLILSCLSALLPVADSHNTQVLIDIRKALQDAKHAFHNSTARLYTPNIENITKCTYAFIDCYLLEMNVVLHEENVIDDRNQLKIKLTLAESERYKCLARHPCELQELTNSTVFYERMNSFLQKLNVLCQDSEVSTCD